MDVKDFSLVCFTILGQMAVGMALMATLRPIPAEGQAGTSNKTWWFIAGCCLVAGLIASTFHLGHPEGSIRTLTHLGKSWLSREVLAFGVFGALVAATWFTAGRRAGKSPLGWVATLAGVVALLVSGMVYAPPSFPALNNIAPLVLFLLTAVILGSAFASYLAGEKAQPLLAALLAAALVLGLVVNLLLPSMWMAGSKAAQLTGENFLSSGTYWARLVVEFVIPLAALAYFKRIAVWIPIFVLAGEFFGRIMFFGSVVHTAATIGGLQ